MFFFGRKNKKKKKLNFSDLKYFVVKNLEEKDSKKKRSWEDFENFDFFGKNEKIDKNEKFFKIA